MIQPPASSFLPLVAALLLGAGGCRRDLCRERPPALEVDVVLGQGVEAAAVRRLRVRMSAAGLKTDQVLEVGSKLVDRRTNFFITVGEPGKGGFSVDGELAALDDGGRAMARGELHRSATGDACNFFEVVLEGGARDGGIDADAKGGCSPPCDPLGATPICAAGKCRGCREHAECRSAGELCAIDGSCPPEAQISYVSPTCVRANQNGTKAHPYCSIAQALAGGKKRIKARPGTYQEDPILAAGVELYGEPAGDPTQDPATRLQLSGCGKVLVAVPGVVLSGFHISANLTGGEALIVVDSAGEATLHRNTIGSSGCLGVSSSGMAKLVRNLIVDNQGGGVQAKGRLFAVNNIIVSNGGAGLTLQGQAADMVNNNNTVAGNKLKGGGDGGVICQNQVTVGNTILFDNSGKPLGQNCQADSCLTGDPSFVGGDIKKAAYYHLKDGSQAKGNGNVFLAPVDDYDGDLRVDGEPDVGADEIVP